MECDPEPSRNPNWVKPEGKSVWIERHVAPTKTYGILCRWFQWILRVYHGTNRFQWDLPYLIHPVQPQRKNHQILWWFMFLEKNGARDFAWFSREMPSLPVKYQVYPWNSGTLAWFGNLCFLRKQMFPMVVGQFFCAPYHCYCAQGCSSVLQLLVSCTPAGKKCENKHKCTSSLSFTLVLATFNWQVLLVCDSFWYIHFPSFSHVQPFGIFPYYARDWTMDAELKAHLERGRLRKSKALSFGSGSEVAASPATPAAPVSDGETGQVHRFS